MKQTPTFAQHMTRAVIRALVVFVIVGAALILMGHSTGSARTAPDAGAGKPVAVGSTADLIAKHNCWTGDAPAGVIPGHVVFVEAGMPRIGGARMVHLGLEVIFHNAPSEIEEWVAFCP